MARPDVWGEGALFGASGLETRTHYTCPFLGTLLPDRIGFVLRTLREKTLWIGFRLGPYLSWNFPGKGPRPFTDIRFQEVSHRIVQAELRPTLLGPEVRVTLFPTSGRSGVLEAEAEGPVELILVLRAEASKALFREGDHFRVHTDLDGMVLQAERVVDWRVLDSMGSLMAALNRSPDPFPRDYFGDKEVRYLLLRRPLSPGEKAQVRMAVFPLSEEPPEVREESPKSFRIGREKDFYARTYAKALSVLHANIYSPEGVFRVRWTTPDRWPHRHLWLWDSAFHALGLRHVDPKLAGEILLAVLETQFPDGFIAHWWRPDGTHSDITQPPLLGWAALKVFQVAPDQDFARAVLPYLRRYYRWLSWSRDENGNGLLEWVRSDESGMDNSSRFYRGTRFDAVDFNAFWALDLEAFAVLAQGAGATGEAEWAAEERAKLLERIRTHLFDPASGWYRDRYFSGEFSPFLTASSLMVLPAGVPTAEEARKLAGSLAPGGLFHAAFLVPTEPLSAPTCDLNMWRGPVWLNYNALIEEGLRRYGEEELAREIRQQTLDQVVYWYLRDGTIYEFYDPRGLESPAKLPRKDTFGAIREFGWSCAVFVDFYQRGGDRRG